MRGAGLARAFGIDMVERPYDTDVLVAAIQVALDNRLFPSPPRRRLPTSGI